MHLRLVTALGYDWASHTCTDNMRKDAGPLTFRIETLLSPKVQLRRSPSSSFLFYQVLILVVTGIHKVSGPLERQHDEKVPHQILG